MRILMLTCHPTIRGPFPKILPLLASALRSQGCLVVEEPWGRHFEVESFWQKIIGRIGDIARVRRRLKAGTFDLLLVQTTTEWRNYSRDIPVIWLCRHLVKQVVVQFHGSAPEAVLGPGHTVFKVGSRQLFRLVDAVVVSSSEEKRDWQAFEPRARVFTARNPYLPPELVAEECGADAWNLPKQVPVILFVGRLIPQKGIFDLLEAVKFLHGRVPFHLLAIGYGPAAPEFEDRARSLGLKDIVTLAGFVDDHLLRCAYRSSAVFVLPSWSEGFPTVLLEAMDAGLPIVTTRLRGAVDHLEDGIHACFVPRKSPASLAKALELVIRDKPLAKRMSTANRAKIREFLPDAVGREYVAILHEVCGTDCEPKRAQEAVAELLPS